MAKAKMSGKLVLGIDIGTTSVKVVVYNSETKEVIAKQDKDTQSNVPSDQGLDGNKQDVPKIISALNICVAKLPKDLLRQITKIGVCGQMHGIMLWDNGDDYNAWERVEKDGNLLRFTILEDKVSALYTWQDNRCDLEFLTNLPTAKSHLPVHTGYGVVTLFWMVKNRPKKLEKFNCSGTIQDFAVAMLCNLKKPVMSVQNAASWGYFDCVEMKWNDILGESQFPIGLLPEVKQSGDVAGCLAECWHTIPSGTPVGVSLGDLQCSVLATLEQETTDAVLNISTSAQMAFIAKDYVPEIPASLQPIQYYPFFDGKYLAVAASLNGGNVLATFVKMLQQWTMELGFSVPQCKVWQKILELGLDESSVSNLRIEPTLLGERHLSETGATVSNVNIGNLGLGQVFRALCRGLLENLHSMMPREILEAAHIQRIVGNGSGLSRNKVLQLEVQHFYKLPLVFTSGGDAAKGAAIAMTLNENSRG